MPGPRHLPGGRGLAGWLAGLAGLEGMPTVQVERVVRVQPVQPQAQDSITGVDEGRDRVHGHHTATAKDVEAT